MSTPAVREVQPLRRTRRDLGSIGRLIVAYIFIRLIGIGMLNAALTAEHPDGGFGAPNPPTLYDKLGAWDGGWYIKIAANGYPDHLSLTSPREDATAPLVFPPLYPATMRLLQVLGLPSMSAGLLVTALAGIAAVVGVYAVARDFVPRRASMLTAIIWAAGPMTIVLSMVYSEALFVALAAWAIWLARRGWWLTAGVLALLSGLTRSTGLAVGAGLVVAAALALRAGRARLGGEGASSDRWRPVVGAALGLIGVPLWWLYVAIVSGRPDGWFAAQDFFWGSRFDFGASVVSEMWRALNFGGSHEPMTRFVYAAATFALLGALVLLAALLARTIRSREAVWWPVAVYAVVLVVLAVGSDGFIQSKIRFLIPMFPLLLLPASRLAGASRTARWGLTAFVVLAGAWLSAYLMAVWPYAI